MVQERLCLTCSKPFEVPPTSKRKYCSLGCQPKQSHSTRARPNAVLDCAHCGTTFERKAWIAEKAERLKQAQYCSTVCRDAARSARKGERRVEYVTKACANCGKEFEAPPHSNKRFCSHRCGGKRGGRRPARERYVNNDGYVMVYVPPGERPTTTAPTRAHHPEHRLVMAKVLGRWVESHESVHHINGDRTDNRPENLQLRSGQHGKGGVLRCRACGSSDIEHVELT